MERLSIGPSVTISGSYPVGEDPAILNARGQRGQAGVTGGGRNSSFASTSEGAAQGRAPLTRNDRPESVLSPETETKGSTMGIVSRRSTSL